MKLRTIMDPNFQQAMRELNSTKIPLKAAWTLQKTTDLIEKEIEGFNKAKVARIQSVAAKDKKGKYKEDKDGNFVLTPADKEAIEAELATTLDTDVAVPTLKVSELGDNVQISVATLTILGELITE